MNMANPLKQLAGETAIYGLSSILAKVVNFLLVPLYTAVLTRAQYGVVTEFMAYIAIAQVVLTLGLETGCFRFASKEGGDSDKVFSNAFITVLGICLLFFCGVSLFADGISSALGYEGFSNMVVFTTATLLLDCPAAIIFARLRFDHKALKFAVIRTLKILTEVGVNLYLYLAFPKFAATHPDNFLLHFVSATPDYTYALFAIVVSCVVCILMLLPDILRLRWRVDAKVWKALMLYSLPIMIAGLPGVLNDFLDRLLMRHFVPGDWRADLGVYQAGVKIAVIMTLFVQMFRYAAEPFFFHRDREKNNKQLFARVTGYFTAFCMIGFLGIMLYIDIIGMMLGKDFRLGLGITPIMLMANVLLGLLFNVNMWYKLSGKTTYAVWITLAGLVASVVLNVCLMPRFSYHAAAWGHLVSYLVMLAISAYLGAKNHPIPYNWFQIGGFMAAGVAVYGISRILPEMAMWPKMAVHTVLLAAYAFPVVWLIYKDYKKSTQYESQNSQ